MIAASCWRACRRKPDRRFVEQQQRRVGRQRSNDLHHALLSAGERTRLLVGQIAPTPISRSNSRARLVAAASAAADLRPNNKPKKPLANLRVQADQNILQCCQIGKQATILKCPPRTACRDFVRGELADFFATEQDAAGIRHDIAGYGIEQCGLAGAVRPDQGADLASCSDLNDTLSDGDQAAEPHRDIAQLQELRSVTVVAIDEGRMRPREQAGQVRAAGTG